MRIYTHKLVVAYDGPFGERGTVLSRHTSYELAEKALRKYSGGFVGIREIES